MKTFAVTTNNELVLDKSGNLSVVSELEAVSQACEQAIKSQLTEMIYAQRRGVPTFQSVWVGSPNLLQFDTYARAMLRSVPSVVEVLRLDTIAQNNTLNYNAEILTDIGTVAINGQL